MAMQTTKEEVIEILKESPLFETTAPEEIEKTIDVIKKGLEVSYATH